GDVTVHSTDASLIVAIAGAVAANLASNPAVGASISYNRISNGLMAVIDGSTVTSTQGAVTVSAPSPPLLVPVGAAGSGTGGKNTAVAGTLTINSIADKVDAHVTASTVTASGDVSVTSSEAASEYVAALGLSVNLRGNAVGASIAYNFLGGIGAGA